MANETLRRNLENAFDPGPGFPDRLLLSRTMAILDADAKAAGRGRKPTAIFLRWPRTDQRVVATLLLVILALAAVGVFLIAHRASNQTVPAGSRDGTIVFGRIDAAGNENVFTIRPDGTGEKRLLSTQPCCSDRPYIRWSHHGDRLLLTASVKVASGQVVTAATVRTDGSDYRVLPVDSSGLNLGPGAWSPNDSRIAFEGWDDGDASRNGIYTADATNVTNRLQITTSGALRDIPISYSPDGLRILFRRGVQDCGESGDLFVVSVDGGHLTQVNPPGTMVTCNLGGPGDWSPDGTKVSFAALAANSAVTGRSAAFVAGLTGTNAMQITEWGTDTSSAHWSPAGDWIVFDRAIAGSPPNHGIFLIHPDGSGLKAIHLVDGACCAVWSPGGDRLLFRAGPDQAVDLWTVKVDGTDLTRLTNTPANLADVSWGGPSG
jgi:hypothetical protein